MRTGAPSWLPRPKWARPAPPGNRDEAGTLQLNLDVAGTIADLNGLTDFVLRAIAAEIANEIIVGGTYGPGTPVDTGFLRGNWDAAIDQDPNPGHGRKAEPAGTATAGRIEAVINGLGAGQPGFGMGKRLVLANTAPYAAKAELGYFTEDKGPPALGTRVKGVKGFTRYEVRSVNGYSHQAPQGMVGIVFAAAPQIARDTVEALRSKGMIPARSGA